MAVTSSASRVSARARSCELKQPRISAATEARMASFVVVGIKEDVGDFGQCAIASKLEFGVKFSSEARDLAKGGFHAAELLH